ncbi:hypothetical protein CGC49_09890 [Capnocytophaga sp. H4358]|uniref:PSP1 domain-containing protein n=1 Tax=Capnocytophaga sp. H4358 TaxID=1945658 RepID=UPI000BB1A10C|nr:regulatory iron-sulfur-containing complex subunit RicT [Capnocytophaga sp. H4358]ATA73564.1 hypothetical protein CGC49_09890 [Capnocytophaga sp. H4358]
MSCNSCTTKNKKGGGCSGGCSSGGCNSGKLAVFDWLSNVRLPGGQDFFDCVEVRFKNSRKEYFKNTEKLSLQIGDVVATEASSGHDVGVVTLTGELVRLQMKKRKIDWNGEGIPKVYRKANQRDIDIWQESRDKEIEVQKRSRELAIALGLEMKISDVEFQGDGSKATFYYTAEGRVDFRQLIKDMARAFSVRIEMRQIGFRQEAARLGGIGSCGRELCCSTWLTDFRTVTTSAARYQQLSLNPQKLAGQCGKLKCCLNFELDSYVDALQDFPRTETKLHTEKGKASCQKIDIFKRLMWYSYDEDPINWHKLSVESVKEIIAKNGAGDKDVVLEDYAITAEADGIGSGIGMTMIKENTEDSLTRFDKPKRKKKKNDKRSKNNKAGNQNGNETGKTESKVEIPEKQVDANVQHKNEQRKPNQQVKIKKTQPQSQKHNIPIENEKDKQKNNIANQKNSKNPKHLKEKNPNAKRKSNHFNKNSTDNNK